MFEQVVEETVEKKQWTCAQNYNNKFQRLKPSWGSQLNQEHHTSPAAVDPFGVYVQ